ncbi:4-oxalmesaconate hydratase [Calycomorphotria hydatis]|uniref:4-oxalmesaconate hydratase n=2 Tax=Calycomorphotria hydatis TaxID=2528027 RepID=A0A517T956_9PLAN|nr:4-oxalmesaconate hydratase [Calycomorphotria hydatis]
MTKRAFAIAAHPDDIEFCMAGTLLLLGKAGYELHYMNIANGCCGSLVHGPEETARIRREEGRRSAELMNAHFHESIANDLEVFYDKPLLTKVAAVMRRVAPDILLVHSPQDYMEDHTNACRLAVSAAFAMGIVNYTTDPDTKAVQKPVTIYHAQPHGNHDPSGAFVKPEIAVDISSVMETKAEALALHESQRKWLDETQGMDSYINTMKQFGAEVAGKFKGPEFAEGWRKHLHAGFCSPDADPLSQALTGYCYS